MFDLSGKTALVTGSTRGIGRAIAEGLIAAGARVVIASEDAADTARVAAELAMPGLACDVADDAALAGLVDFTCDEFGRLDILVCNAGITGKAGPFASIDMDDYARVMDVNLRSQVVLCNLALPRIATELSAPLLADEAFMQRRMAMTPLRRPGTPQEVAGAAVFLGSAAGAFVSGHNLVVDGGTLISDGR